MEFNLQITGIGLAYERKRRDLLTHQATARIGGHYFHTWCPSVRHKNKLVITLPSKSGKQNNENNENENLLAVTWWVILISPDLL